jgi:hypothetical protein
MKSEVTTRVLSASEFGAWERVVADSEAGSPYSTPAYLDALATAAGGTFQIVVAERGGQIVGGVGLYVRETWWGRIVMPRLLLYYNGFVLRPHPVKYPSQGDSWHTETLAALEAELRKSKFSRLRLKSRRPMSDARVFLAAGWSVSIAYTYVVRIRDLTAAWGRVEGNLRRLVERCRQQGVVLTEDDDFDSFYRQHALTHERKGAEIYLPREAFRAFIARLRAAGLARLYHARLPDGRSIACQLVLVGSHRVTHTVSAGADPEHLRLGASAFLRWSVFERLCADGYEANDLTDAALNPVTHFKSQLGGDLEACIVVSRPDRSLLRWAERGAGASGALRRIAGRRRGGRPK